MTVAAGFTGTRAGSSGGVVAGFGDDEVGSEALILALR
jgi:hypothetical protein